MPYPDEGQQFLSKTRRKNRIAGIILLVGIVLCCGGYLVEKHLTEKDSQSSKTFVVQQRYKDTDDRHLLPTSAKSRNRATVFKFIGIVIISFGVILRCSDFLFHGKET